MNRLGQVDFSNKKHRKRLKTAPEKTYLCRVKFKSKDMKFMKHSGTQVCRTGKPPARHLLKPDSTSCPAAFYYVKI